MTIAYFSLFVAVIPGERIYLLSRQVNVSVSLLPFDCQNLCLAERTLVEQAPSPQLLGGYYARGEATDLRQAAVAGARFRQCELRLADLRDVSIDPMPTEQWAHLYELGKGTKNGGAVQRIKAAMERARDDPALDFRSAKLEGAVHQGAGAFAQRPPPPGQGDYHQELAQYLGTLSCQHPRLAERLADRACEAFHQTDPAIQAFAVALAKAMLDKEREAAKPLSPETRARLEALTSSP